MTDEEIQKIADKTADVMMMRLRAAGLIEDKKSNCEKTEGLLQDFKRYEAITDDSPYINSTVKRVKKALREIESDRYYRVITLYYFEGKTREQIAEVLGCSVTTVRRAKKRLINEIGKIVFPEESLREALKK